MAKKLFDDDLLYLFPVQKLFNMINCIFFLLDFPRIGIFVSCYSTICCLECVFFLFDNLYFGM